MTCFFARSESSSTPKTSPLLLSWEGALRDSLPGNRETPLECEGVLKTQSSAWAIDVRPISDSPKRVTLSFVHAPDTRFRPVGFQAAQGCDLEHHWKIENDKLVVWTNAPENCELLTPDKFLDE